MRRATLRKDTAHIFRVPDKLYGLFACTVQAYYEYVFIADNTYGCFDILEQEVRVLELPGRVC